MASSTTTPRSKTEAEFDPSVAPPQSNGQVPTNGHSDEPEPTNPFDLKALRARRASGKVGAIKVFRIEVRKPKDQVYFRVHPGDDYYVDCDLFISKETGTIFWVGDAAVNAFPPGSLIEFRLFTCMTAQSSPFLWPCKLPSEGGRKNKWYTSALEAAEQAKEKWTRIQANMTDGRYDRWNAAGKIAEPEWSAKTLQEMIEIGFKDELVNTPDHFVIRQLAGDFSK